MGKRFKSKIAKRDGPRSLGLGGTKRLEAGENWLLVWSQELACPLTVISRKSRIDLVRLLEIESGKAIPTNDEFEAITNALGTRSSGMGAPIRCD